MTGLETLVSGVYIEAVPSDSGRLTDKFRGVSAAKADFATEEKSGFEIIVTGARTQLGVGTPVTYRGLTVGKIGRKTLSPDGRTVESRPDHRSPLRGSGAGE